MMSFFLFAVLPSLMAQDITVSGRVLNSETKRPVEGVSISVKGNDKIGAITDAEGLFTINVAPTATLVFSSLGYSTQEVAVNNQRTLSVNLESKSTELSDVVVIGYGTRQKKDVTGAISTVSSSAIEKSTAPSAELAIQGRLAGVQVSTPSGNPNDRLSVRIRGVNTFNGVNDPLYVIDGIPLTEGGAGSGQAVLQDLRTPINIFTIIDPTDIESISVLKDASAAAIYGVRAANGVILITTKRGKTGKPKVDVNGYYGIQNSVSDGVKVLNPTQYVALYKEAYANNPNIDNGNPVPFADVFGPEFDESSAQYLGNRPFTDWQNAYLNKNAPVKDLNVKISGANESLNYYVSAGYYSTEATLKGSKLDRYSLALNLTSRVSKWLEVGTTIRLVNQKSLNETSGDLGSAISAPPWQPIYDPNGPRGYAPVVEYMFEPNPDFDPALVASGPVYNVSAGYPRLLWGQQTRFNPFGFMALGDNTYNMNRAIGNGYVQIMPVKGLKIKGSLGGDYLTNKNDNYSEFETYLFSQTPGNPYGRDSNFVASINERYTTNTNLLKEVMANYTLTVGEHNFDVTAAASEQEWTWKIQSAGGGLYYTDPNLRFTNEQQVLSNGGLRFLQKRALIGYIGRLSYKYGDRYYFDASVRRDGSSRFAPGHRWGTFPAMAVAWRVTRENFMAKANFDWLNDLKIRANWGQLGNDQGTEGFAYLSSVNPGITSPDYSTGSGNGDPYGTQQFGAYLPNFPNTSLSWETLTTTGVGFDAIMLRNRLSLTFEYYNKITTDIIQSVSLPPSTGIQNPTDLNVAKVRNRGIEIQVGYNDNIGPVNVSFNGNFTTVNNEVLKLNNGAPWADNVREGYSMYYIRGYKAGGIFQTQQEIDAWRAIYTDLNAGGGAYQQQPGDVYFLDVHGNPKVPGEYWSETPDSIINDNDRTYLGKTIPGHFYGFNIGANWKGIDLSIFFQGVGDVQKYDYAREGGENMSSNGGNQWVTTLNRWTPQNPSTSMTRAVYGDPNGSYRFSDRYVENAGFLRLKNLQIGYTVPKSVMRSLGFVQSFRIYFSGVNLFTITPWKGLDPENDFYPPAKQILFGFNASF